jgi:hypothetical protein
VIERRNMTDELGNQGLPKGQGEHENKTDGPVDVPGVPKGGGVGDMSEDGSLRWRTPNQASGPRCWRVSRKATPTRSPRLLMNAPSSLFPEPKARDRAFQAVHAETDRPRISLRTDRTPMMVRAI